MSKNKGSLKDLDKIISDPESYARDITVKKLVSILQKLSDKYYNTGDPYVTDEIYDTMYDILKERDPNNSFLFQVGAPENRLDTVKLPYPMGSMNKVKPGEKTLERWIKKYTGPYIASDKLDGVSALLHKDTKSNINLYTRGNGLEGRNITYLLKYLINDSVLKNIPKDTALRGEIIISKKDFKKFEDEFKNSRNMISGLVNTDKIDTRIAKKAQLIMYSMTYPRYTHSYQIELMKKWKLNVVYNLRIDINDGPNKIEHIEKRFIEILTDRKKNSDFEVDGIVIVDDSKSYLHNEGNPAHAVAFKMNIEENMKDVKVKKVIWEPSMYGYLQPVLEIEPTELSGTTITYVTAHNASYVYDNKIGSGSIVKIVRSGDVIPYVVKIVKSNKEPDMPDIEYEWNDTEIDILVVNPSEDTQRIINIKRILHFFRTLKVKYLSEGIITKIFDSGYNNVFKIISADQKKLYNIEGLGKRMVTKIYKEIEKGLEKCTLEQLMSASLTFGRGLGSRKLKEILKMYPDILKHDPKKKLKLKEKILDVEGFSDILATKFSENFDKFITFWKKLKETTDIDLELKVKAKQKVKSSVDLTSQKIVMSGFRDQEMSDFIENNGGKVTTSVSKNTTLVIHIPVTGDESSKVQKARKLGVELITKDEFISKYMKK